MDERRSTEVNEYDSDPLFAAASDWVYAVETGVDEDAAEARAELIRLAQCDDDEAASAPDMVGAMPESTLTFRDIRVVDGYATMPNGARVRSDSKFVRTVELVPRALMTRRDVASLARSTGWDYPPHTAAETYDEAETRPAAVEDRRG
jgi:hypothetical protein